MSTAYEQALEALELVAGTPEVRGGVFVLDQQDIEYVRRAGDALRGVMPASPLTIGVTAEQYLGWVLESGSATERSVAHTALRLLKGAAS